MFFKVYSILLLLLSSSIMAQRNVGVNISDISNYSSQIIFVDVMKQSSGWQLADTSLFDWTGGTTTPSTTAEGYPAHVPFYEVWSGDSLIVYTNLLNTQPAPWYYPSGNYTLIFDGTGEVVVDGDVVPTPLSFTTSGVHHIIPVVASGAGIKVFIKRSSASDPIRNIRFILPSYENTYQTNPYLPEFINLISSFSTLRFMKPLTIENNRISNWNDRTLPEFYHYHDEDEGQVRISMPYEHVIGICNLVQKDLWLNIPVAADNNYIQQLAILMRDSLSPNLTIHLEYANETWNPYYFVNRNYVDSVGLFRGYDGNPFIAGQKFHTVRSIEVFQIFDAVFINQTNRLNHVIASQATWNFTGRVIVDALKDPVLNPTGYMPDALAIAPYLGDQIIDNVIAQNLHCTIDENDIMDSLDYNYIPPMDDLIRAHSFWADSMNIDLITYESGQYLIDNTWQGTNVCANNLIKEANSHHRMNNWYCEYYNHWFNNWQGGLLMAFTLCESFDHGEAFGLVESVFQNPTTSPKWVAHEDCVFNYTSIEEDDQMKNQVEVYPNPSNGIVNLAIPDWKDEKYTINVSTVYGQIIQKQTVQQENTIIDLSDYPSTVYFLSIQFLGNNQSIKIIKN